MTFAEFIKRFTGVGVDWDGFYGAQCVDLVRLYLHEVWDKPQFPSVVGAKDIYDKIGSDYERTDYSQGRVPQYGDVVVWDGRLGGGYGHVGIFVEGNKDNFRSFDQNWPTGSPSSVVNHPSYYAVRGWFKPKVVQSSPEPIAPPMDDIRLTILEANNIKTEGQLREVLGAWNDYTPLKNDLANARKEIEKLTQVENKYEELKKIHESVKDDFEKDLAEVEEKNRIYREFLVRLAKKVGSTQNIEDVEAKIGTLVKDSQELKEIQDDRPLVKHPFEGIGDKINSILELVIKRLKDEKKK